MTTLINDYKVSFITIKNQKQTICNIVATHPAMISIKKDSNGNPILAKIFYIEIKNDLDFYKLKILAESITTRKFPKINYPSFITGFKYDDINVNATWLFR